MSLAYRDDPVLAGMLRYWESKRAGRAMPRRDDIDPMEIPKLLPYLSLAEVGEEGRRFRYRLVGTAVVEAYGLDYTGLYVDELLSGDRRAFVESLCRTVVTEKRPLFARSEYSTKGKHPFGREPSISAHRVMMPLSENGTDVSMILTAFSFISDSPLRQTIDIRSPTGLEPRVVQVLSPEEVAAAAAGAKPI
ncbi:MAG TPA: PAS domain-containing protein [Alphaproteobacteria bacterium]|nr:PAS domain-containing protein [Alphaproteobacteria bacterium]